MWIHANPDADPDHIAVALNLKYDISAFSLVGNILGAKPVVFRYRTEACLNSLKLKFCRLYCYWDRSGSVFPTADPDPYADPDPEHWY
jgi:hypothetical protein